MEIDFEKEYWKLRKLYSKELDKNIKIKEKVAKISEGFEEYRNLQKEFREDLFNALLSLPNDIKEQYPMISRKTHWIFKEGIEKIVKNYSD